MNETILAKYRTERAAGVSPVQAMRVARSTYDPVSTYPFLTDLTAFNSATGEVDGLKVSVRVVPDEDYQLGEDDVTGWFTNDRDSDVLRNTCRNWGSDYNWYHPSNYDLQYAGGSDAPKGTSKQVAREWAAERIRTAMREDAYRSAYGVIVTVSLDDVELGSASLWGIDGTDSYDAAPYLREVAEELIPEAMAEADERAHQLAEKLTNR